MSAVESRAIRFHEVGEPLNVLREEQTQVADPGEGRIRIRVAATGLNPADWELCRGFMPGPLPRGIGFDVAGTVDAIGAGVDDVTVGDLVFGSSDFAAQPSAGAADFAILNLWFAVPAGLDPVNAAVLPMVLETAVWTLDLMGVKSGETVLIHGAGGMVGYTAVQVALRTGTRVIATAGSTFAGDLEGFGAVVTPYGDGLVRQVRALADGPIDHVLDVSRPNTGAIAALIEIAGDPEQNGGMCGRFVVARATSDRLPTLFDSLPAAAAADATNAANPANPTNGSPLHENYNVAPTDPIAAIRTRHGERELATPRWGFVPSWYTDLTKRPQPINARIESVEVAHTLSHYEVSKEVNSVRNNGAHLIDPLR
ncbi:MAG: alcohol dehydrogenase [Frondihabitans sp.]|nr:alcohol dehydrogenase [Frondihabitans sp.]